MNRVSTNLSPPWPKGRSGNPRGFSGPAREAQRLAKENSPDAIKRLIELMASPDERVACAACAQVLDRGLGKPKEPPPDPVLANDLDFDRLSDEELLLLERLIHKAGTDTGDGTETEP